MAIVHEVLQKTAVDALEDWGMMLCEDAEEDTTNKLQSDANLLHASMNYVGVVDGELSLIAPRSFADALCCNLLAKDFGDDVDEEELEDCMKELCNVILGNFLTEAYGTDVTFDLTLPRVRSTNAEGLTSALDKKLQIILLADDEPILLTIGKQETKLGD